MAFFAVQSYEHAARYNDKDAQGIDSESRFDLPPKNGFMATSPNSYLLNLLITLQL